MSERSDMAKLEFVLELINDIGKITARHGGAGASMDDYEGRHALMMCLMQIGETLYKIESEKIHEKLPVDLAYKMRNIIAHDYIGVNRKIIIQTIETDIPELSLNIKTVLGNL